MKKGFLFLVALVLTVSDAVAVNNSVPKKFDTITSHDGFYPYVLNNKKTGTNTKKTSTATTTRRAVVPRSNTARSAQKTSQQRRVVQRTNSKARATNVSNMRSNANARAVSPIRVRNATNTARANTTTNTKTEKVSSQRCLADYKSCMESYCRREDTAYNRCYCSSRLAQIDSKYQNKIDDLIQQIIRLQYNSSTTSEDIKEYWDKTVGAYSNDNPWVGIDNALNIEWADMQSRVRGQNAFNTGHEYCVQHLRACYYMASNLRDAYKSEIVRDCDAYEKSLQKIQDVAESVIKSYHD